MFIMFNVTDHILSWLCRWMSQSRVFFSISETLNFQEAWALALSLYLQPMYCWASVGDVDPKSSQRFPCGGVFARQKRVKCFFVGLKNTSVPSGDWKNTSLFNRANALFGSPRSIVGPSSKTQGHRWNNAEHVNTAWLIKKESCTTSH